MRYSNQPKELKAVAAYLFMLSNPVRIKILKQIGEREISARELNQIVGLSQPGLSQHLALLRAEKLVRTRRDAQTIYYSLPNNSALQLLDAAEEILKSRSVNMT